MGEPFYPNMYIILVAEPGVGKGVVVSRVRDLWKSLEDHHVASSSVTKASLMDELNAAERRIVTHNPINPVDAFNSLLLCVNEMGVFLPAYENEFMNTLTDLWDCKDYSESRRYRKNDNISIGKTQLNLLAAAQPGYLATTMPEGAWDMGFASRTIMVYSGDQRRKSLFATSTMNEEENEFIRDQLNIIGSLYGELQFTPEAAERIDAFHMSEHELTRPTHPKLRSYAMRRTAHLLKLCMVAAISRSDELVIGVQEFQRALDWMIEAETFMPDIFKAMTSGGTGKIMEEAWYFLFSLHTKKQEPVPEHKLIQFLQERVPVHNIKTTIDMMDQGKMIEQRLTTTGKAWVPLGRK